MTTYRTWQDLLDDEDEPREPADPGAEADDVAPDSGAPPPLPDTFQLPLELLELQAEKERLERHLKSLTGQGEPDPGAAREAAMYPMPIFTVESRIEQRKLRRLEESLRILARRRLEVRRIEEAAKRRNREALEANQRRSRAEQARRQKQIREYLRWLQRRDARRAAEMEAARLLARARAVRLRQEEVRREERRRLDAESAARIRAANVDLRPLGPFDEPTRKRAAPVAEPTKPAKKPTSRQPSPARESHERTEPSRLREQRPEEATPRRKEPFPRRKPPLRTDTRTTERPAPAPSPSLPSRERPEPASERSHSSRPLVATSNLRDRHPEEATPRRSESASTLRELPLRSDSPRAPALNTRSFERPEPTSARPTRERPEPTSARPTRERPEPTSARPDRSKKLALASNLRETDSRPGAIVRARDDDRLWEQRRDAQMERRRLKHDIDDRRGDDD